MIGAKIGTIVMANNDLTRGSETERPPYKLEREREKKKKIQKYIPHYNKMVINNPILFGSNFFIV